ncbi:MAG TPA: erythromycin esterase family protein [Thermoanaerobaculia bacterium]|jgi:erythromycin esterase|nr:erythromycin esterase family protein [Thermoanaerobaculia bacterium]
MLESRGFAVAAALTLSLAALAQPAALERGKPLAARLRGGEQHEYALRLRAGMYAHVTVEQQGIDVVVTALAPDGKPLAEIDSPNGANGPEPLGFAATASGTHRVVVRSFDATAAEGAYVIRVDELLSRTAYRARVAEERQREVAVSTWLREHAIALRSAEPGAPLDDLAPLASTLRDARIVGLGEATHGSHELFTLKHRLIELLITRLGYRVIAFEGTASGGAAIDAYIHGSGDRAAAMNALASIWITQNAEVASLIEWLRAYNAGVAEADRVRFVGLDPQGSATEDATLRAFLRAAGAEERFRALLDFVRIEDEKANRFERTNVRAARVHELEALVAYLVAREGDLVRRTSPRDYEAALTAARHLVQFAQFNSDLPRAEAITRDEAMADNFFRAVPADARAIVWAHNAHVSTNDRSSYKPLGALLRNAYGTRYYALATSFNRGSFRAQVPGSTPPDVRSFTLPAALPGTIDALLAAMRMPLAIVDLRADAPPPVASWLAEPRRMHWIGALWSDANTGAQAFQPFVLTRDFDGVLFVENTSAAVVP